jgi:hypothetical protein
MIALLKLIRYLFFPLCFWMILRLLWSLMKKRSYGRRQSSGRKHVDAKVVSKDDE